MTPVQSLPYLGFLSDSVKQAFLLPEDKKLKFAVLRDSLLQSKVIPVRSLQKFAGKAVSFSLAVPAARLFCRELNACVGKALKNSKPVKMTDGLRNELEHWKFLDSWDGFLPWREERHCSVKVTSDASNAGWAGIVSLPSKSKEIRDYWCPEDLATPGGIAVKEAKALFKTLSAFHADIFNSKVDAYVDNSNLIDFWNNEGGKNLFLTDEIKDLFRLSLKLNIILTLHYVPSKLNEADAPSRIYSDLDCSLSDSAWNLVDTTFGPHSFNLMALPSNVKKLETGLA